MSSLVNLMPMIGVEKTLIIACGDHGLSKFNEVSDRIFIYPLTNGVLQRHDYSEKGRIQYYVESKECKQLVFVSSVQQNLIEKMMLDESLQSIRAALNFNLTVFLGNHDQTVLPLNLRDELLTEQHIISQCNLLLDYYFIRERVESKQLQIRGLITQTQGQQFKSVFHNGIIYNDIISMN